MNPELILFLEENGFVCNELDYSFEKVVLSKISFSYNHSVGNFEIQPLDKKNAVKINITSRTLVEPVRITRVTCSDIEDSPFFDIKLKSKNNIKEKISKIIDNIDNALQILVTEKSIDYILFFDYRGGKVYENVLYCHEGYFIDLMENDPEIAGCNISSVLNEIE